jgi:hypothetical protein
MRLQVGTGRGIGKTTALCDLALANARAGERVYFWCATHQRAEHAFRIAAERTEHDGLVWRIQLADLTLRLTTERGGGLVRFGTTDQELLGMRYDARVFDGDALGSVTRNDLR